MKRWLNESAPVKQKQNAKSNNGNFAAEIQVAETVCIGIYISFLNKLISFIAYYFS